MKNFIDKPYEYFINQLLNQKFVVLKDYEEEEMRDILASYLKGNTLYRIYLGGYIFYFYNKPDEKEYHIDLHLDTLSRGTKK